MSVSKQQNHSKYKEIIFETWRIKYKPKDARKIEAFKALKREVSALARISRDFFGDDYDIHPAFQTSVSLWRRNFSCLEFLRKFIYIMEQDGDCSTEDFCAMKDIEEFLNSELEIFGALIAKECIHEIYRQDASDYNDFWAIRSVERGILSGVKLGVNSGLIY